MSRQRHISFMIYQHTNTTLLLTNTAAFLRRRGAAGKHNLIHNVDDTIAGLDIGIDDLGHVATRISSTLLVDIATSADGSTIIAIRHLNGLGTAEILGHFHLVDGMKEQSVGQESVVGKNRVKKIAELRKRLVGRSKDGPFAPAQGVAKSSLGYGRTKS